MTSRLLMASHKPGLQIRLQHTQAGLESGAAVGEITRYFQTPPAYLGSTR
jgi:hypothetical protein